MGSEDKGINELNRGALILALASIIFVIFIITTKFFALFLSLIPNMNFPTVISSVKNTLTIYTIIVGIIEYILALIGFKTIAGGFKALDDFGIDVWVGYNGAMMIYYTIYLPLLAGFGLFIIPILNILALFVLILDFLFGPLVIIIGNILIGIGFYKLGGEFDESTAKLGGILIIFFPPVGYVLTYIGLGKIISMLEQSRLNWKKLTTKGVVYVTPPSQPQIYQVGQGIIRSNGVARITLYSSIQSTILSAKIEGTAITSVNISPNVLQPGHAEVAIQFNDISSLIPYNVYEITLVVNMGGKITEIKANASY